jgi:hypothetical protein
MSSDEELVESVADPAKGSQANAAPQSDPATSVFPNLVSAQTVRFVAGSVIAGLLFVTLVISFGALVPAHVVRDLQIQIDSLQSQNRKLRAELELSQTKRKEYENKLEGEEQARSQISQMQATINALEEQVETIRAAEWPPLTASAQESLYQLLKDVPAQEVWIGYADYGGRALAKTFADVFERLNWPQNYPILAVNDPQEGLWITPINDASEQLRDKIIQSTGLQFKLFPRRERFLNKIGVVVGYRLQSRENEEGSRSTQPLLDDNY